MAAYSNIRIPPEPRWPGDRILLRLAFVPTPAERNRTAAPVVFLASRFQAGWVSIKLLKNFESLFAKAMPGEDYFHNFPPPRNDSRPLAGQSPPATNDSRPLAGQSPPAT